MRMKAKAYQQYGDEAVMALVLESLPSIAKQVAKPLAKVDDIVLLGGADKTTSEVTKLISQLPPAVQVNLLIQKFTIHRAEGSRCAGCAAAHPLYGFFHW